MRLKTLEIKGFKSFADQTVINFNEDVIGIVGPNGCGKSNVVDAMRWVLGEQKSSQLRSDKMSNVIFNGTKQRKEGGLAQVSLTFDNTKNILPTEYSTVTITRMLYRSGESEYRLNDVQCRLKDISNLFMDTGIGSDSYAIIALGMVDDLLNDKDNSRRKLFEQASGISKYKIRKRETMNKLKSTSADLERVEDLLFEIEGNLKTLEKQAKRAKKYFELKKDYKTYSIEFAVLRLSNYKEQYNKVKQQIQEQSDTLITLGKEHHNLEAALEEAKRTNLDKEKALTERQRELNNLVGQIRGKENDQKVYAQKQTFITQNKSNLEIQIRSSSEKIEELELSIETYRTRINEEKLIEQQLEDQLEELEKNLESVRNSHGSLKSELDEFMQQQQGLEQAVFELEKKKAIQASQSENLRLDIDRINIEIEQRQGEINTISEKLTQVEQLQKAATQKIETLQQAEDNRQVEITKTETSIEELVKKIAVVNRKKDAKQNEYKLIKSLVENLEGFPESIQFLSKEKTWKKKAPLLSDLIYTDEEYRVPIENFLEGYLNYYVVKNFEEAQEAIELLSNAQKGKANFFILDAFEDYNSPLLTHPNTKRALDLVQVDAPYRKLFGFLLDNVLLVDDERLINNIDNDNLIFLSKSGKYIQRKFSISGGSVGLFEGKRIGRKKNMEILKQEIESLEKQHNDLSQQHFHLKDKINNLKSADKAREIKTETQQLNQLSQKFVSLKTRMENFESFLNEANAKKAQALEKINIFDKDNAVLDKELIIKKQNARTSKEQISQMDGSYRLVADQLTEASQAFNQKNITFIQQQNKINTIQKELSFRERQIEELRTKLKNDQTAFEHSDIELQQVQTDIDTLQKTLLEAYDQKREKEANLTEVEQNYYQSRGGINELEDGLRKKNRERQACQELIASLKEKYNDLRLELTSIGERLKVEFNIGINDVINNELTLNLSAAELEDKVKRFKQRIDNYGEINPMAVEAFDEMKIRFDTITEQKNDIESAKVSLLETIQEIEETATTHFMDAFTKVREHFKNVFRSLFSENDHCDLLLDDPENPLESKIKITAKPKGKRPQTIDQLSGGEKTLTATALLFSLYLLKPAPFCIFDEVDAPLDDANIDKFNRIIKQFSKDSQFIIVTHNKQTMAAVDVIYGVTMQELGVSTVVPVDFRELVA